MTGQCQLALELRITFSAEFFAVPNKKTLRLNNCILLKSSKIIAENLTNLCCHVC